MIPSLSDFQLVLVLSLHQLPPTLGPLGGWSVSQEFASLSLEGRALPHSLLDSRVALAQGVLPTWTGLGPLGIPFPSLRLTSPMFCAVHMCMMPMREKCVCSIPSSTEMVILRD